MVVGCLALGPLFGGVPVGGASIGSSVGRRGGAIYASSWQTCEQERTGTGGKSRLPGWRGDARVDGELRGTAGRADFMQLRDDNNDGLQDRRYSWGNAKWATGLCRPSCT